MRLPATSSAPVRSLLAVLLASALTLVLTSAASGRAARAASASDVFDPGRFPHPRAVTNPWLPLEPGMQLVYRGMTVEGTRRVHHRLVSTVTDLTKVIDGVRTVVVWDRDFSAGRRVEAELAFFAQDSAGNVWELGEYPEEYEGRRIVKSPTWIHGLSRAQAGISMKAAPRVGRPSYSLGLGPAVGFTDRARVVRVGQRTCIPARCFTHVLVVDEFNPDQPGKHQYKYYARGIGTVRVGWSGAKEDSKETLALVDVRRLGPRAVEAARKEALKLEQSAYRTSKSMYGRTPPVEIAAIKPRSFGWAKLAARTGPRGGSQRRFATRSARIVITARVTALPTFLRGMKVEVIRPDGRVVRTSWIRAPRQGETVPITLAHAVFGRHPGRWHARFVVQQSVRSAITFAVRRVA